MNHSGLSLSGVAPAPSLPRPPGHTAVTPHCPFSTRRSECQKIVGQIITANKDTSELSEFFSGH